MLLKCIKFWSKNTDISGVMTTLRRNNVGEESNLILEREQSYGRKETNTVSVSSSEENHGVGGAFVWILNRSFASQIMVNMECTLPFHTLWGLRTGMRSTLHYSCHDYISFGTAPRLMPRT